MPSAAATTAGITRRISALIYDAILATGILVVFFLFPQISIAAAIGYVLPPKALFAHLFLVLLVYFVWFWLRNGQTLAMKTWRIRLISADGGRLRPLQALLRYLFAWPSLLSGLGLLWAIVDPDHQFLHDRIAGTRVVMA